VAAWVPLGLPAVFSGSCAARGAVLPCSVSTAQTYAGVNVNAAGSEAAVQAVLTKVLGPPVTVRPLTGMLTTSTGDVTVTPAELGGAHRFWWSYTGPAQNLAYLTVQTPGGFAVIGVAGLRAGTIDTSTLLGGQPINGLELWTTLYSKPDPIPASALHGLGLVGNVRLGIINNNSVDCVHADTGVVAQCVFRADSGAWAETPRGTYARAGQAITLDGRPGGDYVTGARVNPDGTVPALALSGHDNAGYTSSEELSKVPVVEAAGSPANATGMPLQNFATREVCSSDAVHPDGAAQTRTYQTSSGATVYCYTGRGAALNDPNVTERDQNGVYLSGFQYSHMIWTNGVEVPAAKRPATCCYPTKVTVTSPIVWRSVATGIAIAN